MISFEQFNMDNNSPIYQQIVLYIKRGIVAGWIEDGDELPSRRNLSAVLGVNPNTIQKAFKQLEEEGLIESRAGAKSCMILLASTIDKVKEEMLEQDILGMLRLLKDMGFERQSLHQLIDEMWNMENAGK